MELFKGIVLIEELKRMENLENVINTQCHNKEIKSLLHSSLEFHFHQIIKKKNEVLVLYIE